jgi:hypothetical protein
MCFTPLAPCVVFIPCFQCCYFDPVAVPLLNGVSSTARPPVLSAVQPARMDRSVPPPPQGAPQGASQDSDACYDCFCVCVGVECCSEGCGGCD